MLNDKICKTRDELNALIENGADYDTIYKKSVELDLLIEEYYRNEENTN